MRCRTPSAALRLPASPTAPDRPPATWSPVGGSGTLLAVYPVNGGSARMAIVGYLLPREPVCRPAGAVLASDPSTLVVTAVAAAPGLTSR